MLIEVLENFLDIINEDTICGNTEEIINTFEKYNSKVENETRKNTKLVSKIVGFMDAMSLYPSIVAERAATIVKNEIIGSYVKFEGLDIDEIGKYLRKNMSQKEIDYRKLSEVIPTKKRNKPNHI